MNLFLTGADDSEHKHDGSARISSTKGLDGLTCTQSDADSSDAELSEDDGATKEQEGQNAALFEDTATSDILPVGVSMSTRLPRMAPTRLTRNPWNSFGRVVSRK